MAWKLNSLATLYSGRGFIRGSAAIAREIYGIILKSVLKRRFVSRKIYKFQMILDLDDRGISRTLWLFGQRELDHKWILQQTLKPGSRMLDIGSNSGSF